MEWFPDNNQKEIFDLGILFLVQALEPEDICFQWGRKRERFLPKIECNRGHWRCDYSCAIWLQHTSNMIGWRCDQITLQTKRTKQHLIYNKYEC